MIESSREAIWPNDEVRAHSATEVDALVEAAFRIQDAWSRRRISVRADCLRALAETLRRRKTQLAALITSEMHKPITQSESEVDKCANACDFYAARGPGFLEPEEVPTGFDDAFVRFDPLGVILAIMPWNFPLWQVLRLVAPATIAGNAVLLKHASNVPRCARAIELLLLESDFPEGILTNLRIGATEAQGLLSDPRIAALCATASSEAGASIASVAGAHLKKQVLELGGSDSFIVLDDADLEAAIETGVSARMLNAGQSCVAAKRFIVHSSVADEYVRAYADRIGALRVGDPWERSTDVGPLARPDLLQELARQVDASVAMGATLVAGGRPDADIENAFMPTLLSNVTPSMPVFCEETFGPVAAVIVANDDDEAVGLANQSDYGLGASIWTRDLDREADGVANAVRQCLHKQSSFLRPGSAVWRRKAQRIRTGAGSIRNPRTHQHQDRSRPIAPNSPATLRMEAFVEDQSHRSNSTLSEQLMDFAVGYPAEQIPDEVYLWAAYRFVDTVGVALLAARDNFGTPAARSVLADRSTGVASVWASGGIRVRPDDACFANGMLAHGMEFDDTHTGATMHPSTVLVPVSLAVAEQARASGESLLAAAIVGYEVAARLSMLAPGKFQNHGFHPTSIFGIFGGVAIASRLLETGRSTAVNAAGLAGSMASGLMEYLSDGSDTKQMHPGWAGKGAVSAVRLAQFGATGPATVLEGSSGVYRSFIGSQIDFSRAVADLGQDWVGTKVATKPYPACHCVHAPVDAWLSLRDTHRFTGDDVAHVRKVTGLVPAWYLQLVCDPMEAKRKPRTTYEARFSLPYSLAIAIVDGALGIESYGPGRLSDERVLDLAQRVDYEIIEYDQFPAAFPGGVRVEFENGAVFEEHVPWNRGSVNNPLSGEDIAAKFMSCARGLASHAVAQRLLESLLNLRKSESLDEFGKAMALFDAELTKR